MDFQQLSTFCIVASEKNMTTAANRIKVSQPTVSRQIRLLEEELGVELLNRKDREVVLTIQGQLFYEYASKVLDLLQQAQISVQSMTSHFRGVLNVATVNYIGMSLVSPVIQSFLNPKNEFRITLFYGSAGEIISRMKNKQVDIAILPDLQTEYGVDFSFYGRDKLFQDEIVYAGAKKNSPTQQVVSLSDISQKILVSFSSMFPNFNFFLDQKLKAHNLTLKTVFEVNNIGTLKKIIETGVYYGFIPLSSIQKQIQFGRICTYKVKEIDYKMDVFSYYSKELVNRKLIDILLLTLTKQISLNSKFNQ